MNSKGKTEKDFENELLKFCNTIEGVIFAIPRFLDANSKEQSKYRQRLKKFEKEKKLIRKKNKLFVTSKNIEEFDLIMNSLSQIKHVDKLILPSQYVNLFIVFENYVRQIIKLTLSFKKDKIKETEKQISLSEILDFDKIEDAIFYAIERDIDVALNNKTSLLDWIDKNLNKKIPNVGNLRTKFIQYNGLRNLIVHNNGIVNKRYLKYCLDGGIIDKDLPKVGDKINVDIKTFVQAGINLYILGINIGINLWQHTKPKESNKIESFIINQQVKYINKKAFWILDLISDISINSFSKFSDKKNEYMILINKAIALKNDKKDSEVEKIFNKIETNDNAFKLAVALINKDFSTASKLMGKIKKSRLQDFYETWPLFKMNRRSKLINKTYKKIIGDLTKVSQSTEI